MSPPVQELQSMYRLVHACFLPLRGRLGHVPALHWLFRLSWCVFRMWIARSAATWQSRAGTTDSVQTPLPCHCEERSDVAISCRNYRLRTNLFAPTVCRCADGTPRSLAQPSATKEPYGCGMPLAGTCPTNFDRTLAVGRDDSARRCRNFQK